MRQNLPVEVVLEVRDACLCLATQQAARRLARRFDRAFAPVDLTNGQFSLMMALSAPQAPTVGGLADFLAMDRTTVTAALKALQRRGLVHATEDKSDKRARRLSLTQAGRETLEAALPIWSETHAALEQSLADVEAESLRRALRRLGRDQRRRTE